MSICQGDDVGTQELGFVPLAYVCHSSLRNMTTRASVVHGCKIGKEMMRLRSNSETRLSVEYGIYAGLEYVSMYYAALAMATYHVLTLALAVAAPQSSTHRI